MKAFTNANARDVKHAVMLLQQAHQQGHPRWWLAAAAISCS